MRNKKIFTTKTPRTRRKNNFFLAFRVSWWFIFFIAGCSTPPEPEPPVWSVPVTLGEARQTAAPVLWTAGETITAAWIGEDAAGVHQDARQVTDETLGNVVVLPLPPIHPYRQMSAPAGSGNLHLLWLDEDETNGNRLFSAVISPKLEIERGPTRISDRPTLDYALAPNHDGSLWAVWIGGLLVEPALFVQQIDATGRPLQPQQVATNAVVPALMHTPNDRLWLFWTNHSTQQVYRAEVEDGGAITGATAISTSPRLAPGDRIDSFAAASDAALSYLFWNISRANGQRETLWTWGSISADSWTQPRPLTLGDSALRWAVPLAGVSSRVTFAALLENQLWVGSMSGGEIIDGETVAPVGGLLGPPLIERTAAGRLVVAWAEPSAGGMAQMRVSVRRE